MRKHKIQFMFFLLCVTALICIGCGKNSADSDVMQAESAGQVQSSEAAAAETAQAELKNSSGQTETQEQTAAAETTAVLAFPMELDCGLTVDSFFQYSGLNPDCKDEEGNEVGALQITNTSGKYLEKAEISAELSNGAKLHFLIEELPENESIYVFDTANTECSATDGITELDEEADFAENAGLKEDNYSTAVSGITIDITNVSEKQQKDVTVLYHCVLEDILFGGIAYEKEISSLEKGETVSLTADECYLGECKAVRISQ